MFNIEVHVKTAKKIEKVQLISKETYEVWVKERPIDGQANKAVIKLMADYLNVPKSQLSLKWGRKSKTKILTVHQ